MKNKEKTQAEKKADIAICKLQDIYYLNPTNRITTRIDKALESLRELQTEIENTDTN